MCAYIYIYIQNDRCVCIEFRYEEHSGFAVAKRRNLGVGEDVEPHWRDLGFRTG